MSDMLPLANIIVGAFGAPFFIMLIFWYAVLMIEWPVVYLVQKRRVPFWHTLWLVGAANVVSWFIGAALSQFIPDVYETEISPDIFVPNRTFVFAAFFGIVAAFFLSWLLEYLFIRAFKKFFTFYRLGKAVGYANMVTYLAIYVFSFSRLIQFIGTERALPF